MIYLVIGSLAAILIGFVTIALRRRQQHLLARENEARTRLDLPPLTPAQFALQVEEKSADFRKNINQHM